MFERASRLKVRFNYKGLCTVEDLWDIPLKALDGIYKELNAKVKAQIEESLLDIKSKDDEITSLQIEVVKYIVALRLQEAKDYKDKLDKAQEKQRLLAILAKKQDLETENLSIEELTKRINEM